MSFSYLSLRQKLHLGLRVRHALMRGVVVLVIGYIWVTRDLWLFASLRDILMEISWRRYLSLFAKEAA